MPIIAGAPDSTASLTKLQSALSNLRSSLNERDEKQQAAAKETQSTETNDEGETNFKMSLCAQMVSVKLAHDGMMRAMDETREKIRSAHDELERTRYKLENLQYERRALQQEIDACRDMKSTKLQRVLRLRDNEVHVQNEEDYKRLNLELEKELESRRQLQRDVEEKEKERNKKKSTLENLKSELRQIPTAIGQIRRVVEPIQNAIGHNVGIGGGEMEKEKESGRDLMEQVRKLPEHLYILARQAFAYRDVYDRDMKVRVAEVDDVYTKAKKRLRKANNNVNNNNDEMDTSERVQNDDNDDDDALYSGCGQCVILEVGPYASPHTGTTSKDTNEVRLCVTFRYLTSLRLIVVRADTMHGSRNCKDYSAKELCDLYPEDRGDKAVRVSVTHLKGGKFKFDATRAGGRAFRWANAVCGVDELDMMQGWEKQLEKLNEARRFQDVVHMLRLRLRGIVHMKKEREELRKNKNIKELLISTSEQGDFQEVWRFEIWGRDNSDKFLNVMVTIRPDYPLARPVFRLSMVSGIMTERETTELERNVNETDVGVDEDAVHVLGAQLTRLHCGVVRE